MQSRQQIHSSMQLSLPHTQQPPKSSITHTNIHHLQLLKFGFLLGHPFFVGGLEEFCRRQSWSNWQPLLASSPGNPLASRAKIEAVPTQELSNQKLAFGDPKWPCLLSQSFQINRMHRRLLECLLFVIRHDLGVRTNLLGFCSRLPHLLWFWRWVWHCLWSWGSCCW